MLIEPDAKPLFGRLAGSTGPSNVNVMRPLTKTRSAQTGGRPLVESHTGPDAPSASMRSSVGVPSSPPLPPPQDASTRGKDKTTTAHHAVRKRFTSLMRSGPLRVRQDFRSYTSASRLNQEKTGVSGPVSSTFGAFSRTSYRM